MNDEEITEEIFNKFMDLLRAKNLSLYDRVMDQKFLFIPHDGRYKVLKALKNVSSDEQKLIDELLYEACMKT